MAIREYGMRKQSIFLLFFAGCMVFTKTEKKQSNQIIEVYENSKVPEKVELSLKVFDEFFNELRSELVNSVSKKNFDGAISICKVISPELEKKYSEKYNMKVYRISDRYRNPQHKPTEDEKKVLEFWSQKLTEKKPLLPVYYETNQKMKVMKPIKIFAEMCLQCHGNLDTMDQKLKQALKKEYPNDQAYGYKMNDLRGAFVAEF